MTQPRYLDPELAAALALLDVVDPTDVEAHRTFLRKLWSTQHAVSDTRVTLGYLNTDDGRDAPPVRLRTYWNNDAGPLAPGLLWLHGGGFALGFCELDDELCTWLSAEVGCHVVAPEYRLAPEDPYPAGFEDAFDTLEWMTRSAPGLGIDPWRVAVAGASAGGALAAAVCLRARDEGGPPVAFQLLAYPVTDERLATESMQIFVDSPVFDRPAAELMWTRYLGAARRPAPPYAAPMRASSLAGLPPTYVLTADTDPLRDEGIAYATRLIQDGVETELHHFPGTFHAFDTLSPTAGISQRAWAEYAAALRRALLG